jgi:hypothetical protein
MNVRALPLLIFLLMPTLLTAEEHRFVTKVKLPSGQMAVIAEGDFEARSLGSFTVRLYDKAEAQDETTFFSSGVVLSRNGAVETVLLGDIDKDKNPEIIVNVRSVGSGSYLSAHAFTIEGGTVRLARSLSELKANADTLAELRSAVGYQ